MQLKEKCEYKASLPTKFPPEIVVWISDTFDYTFGIKHNFTKYLKESCSDVPDEYFSSKYFL